MALTWGGVVLQWGGVDLGWGAEASTGAGELLWGTGNTLQWGGTDLAWGDGTGGGEPPGETIPPADLGPIPSSGRGHVYDNDFSSFARKKKRKKLDTDGPRTIEQAPVLEPGPRRSTKEIVDALLRAPSQVEGHKPLEIHSPDDDDEEDVLHLLMHAL